MALMMLVPVQAGGNVDVQQADPAADSRQPSEENKTMYMYWNSTNTKAWTHFDKVENETMETFTEENDDGVIDRLLLIHSAPPQESTGNSNSFWSHFSLMDNLNQ